LKVSNPHSITGNEQRQLDPNIVGPGRDDKVVGTQSGTGDDY